MNNDNKYLIPKFDLIIKVSLILSLFVSIAIFITWIVKHDLNLLWASLILFSLFLYLFLYILYTRSKYKKINKIKDTNS